MDMHTDECHQADARTSAVPLRSNDTLKDPVCGLVVTEQSPYRFEHRDRPYYFCSANCQATFVALVEPAHVALPPRSEAGSSYTCPGHRESRQDQTRTCPKCGMTRELQRLGDEENPELKDFKRRFWWTLPLTLLVTLLAMLGRSLGWFDMARQSWIELVLTLPIVLWAGAPFFVLGARSVVSRRPNMWTLIGLSTGATFLYSLVATVAPQVFPASLVSMGRVAVYFEAPAVIVSLTLLCQILELKARSQTSAAIESLLGRVPGTAHRTAANGSAAEVPLPHGHVCDLPRVHPGEKLPVDGIVVQGNTSLEESMLKARADRGASSFDRAAQPP